MGVLLLSLGNVVAHDIGESDLVSDDSNATLITDSSNSFNDFKSILDENTTNIVLDKNYSYDSSKDDMDGITIGRELTIDGNGYTLNGKNIARILNINASNVVLKNINFINANTSQNGGAVNINGDYTSIINCNFINNSAGNGGAVYSNACGLIVENSTFADNYAVNGAGIFADGFSVTVTNSTFVWNNAGEGAAIYSNTNTSLLSSSFRNNNADVGAAAFLNSDGCIVADSLFENNTAVTASTLFLNGDYNFLADSLFIYNLGNTLLANGNIISICNSTFTSNDAFERSVVIINGSEITIEDSRFTNNYGQSGAVVQNYAESAIIKGSYFENNTVQSLSSAENILLENNYGLNITPVAIVTTESVEYGENLTVDVYVPYTDSSFSEDVLVTVNSINYTASITDHHAKLAISNLNVGIYTVEVFYINLNNTVIITNTTEAVISKKTPSVIIKVSDNIIAGDNLTVEVKVDYTATGKVIINVADKNYTVVLKDSYADFTISDLAAGEYNITAAYLGDENFTVAINSTQFIVSKKTAYLDVVCDDISYGENLVLNIALPGDATGSVRVYIGEEYWDAAIVDGKGQLAISKLDVGIYTLYIVYSGDMNYAATSLNYTVKVKGVNKTTPIVDIHFNDITVGENLIINISVSDNAKGNVTVTVVQNNNSSSANIGDVGSNSTFVIGYNPSSSDSIVHVVELDDHGFACLFIPNLSEGSYIIEVTYGGSEYFTSAYANKTAKVKSVGKTSPIIIIDALADSNTADINITIDSDATGEYTVEIDSPSDVVYNKTISILNSTFNIKLVELVFGNYTVKVTYFGDDKYLSGVNTTVFTVGLSYPDMTVSLDNITYGESLVLNITLPADATGSVRVYVIDDVYFDVDIFNGKGQLTIPNLTAGIYNLSIIYSGDMNYAPAGLNYTVQVKGADKKATSISIMADDIVVGEDLFIIFEINPQISAYLTVTVNGVSYSADGNLTIPGLLEGTYNITARYDGDDNYLACENTTTVIVTANSASTFTDLQQLIDNAIANNQWEITLTHDYYYVSGDSAVTVSSPITINGNGYVIDGSAKSSVFNIVADNVTLANITIMNSEGSAVTWTGSSGIIDNSTFMNNNAFAGAALYAEGDYLTVKNSVFLGNNATFGAGARIVAVYVTVSDSIFENNTALYGAGAEVFGVDVEFVNSLFVGNNATAGAAMWMNSSRTYIGNSKFIYNTADDGAGIINYGIYLTVNNTVFEDNLAYCGAGIVDNGYDTRIIGSVFTKNNATAGAGVLLNGYNASVEDSVFTNNNANMGAGIISIGDDILVFNTTFTGNNATTGAGAVLNGTNNFVEDSEFIANNAETGAGILSYGDNTTVVNTTFVGNNATIGAGAVFNGIFIDVEDSVFVNNTAVTGAGIVSYGDDGSIFNTTFVGNNATVGAGAVLDGFNAFVEDSVFVNNTACSGAGIILSGNDIWITGTLFIGNNVTDGAMVVLKGNNVSIVNSTFVNNTANEGSILMSGGSSIYIGHDEFIDNNAISGAAIYVNGEDTSIMHSYFENNHEKSLIVNGNFTVYLENNTGLNDSSKKTPVIEISASDICYGEDLIINISVSDNATGEIILIITGGYVVSGTNSTIGGGEVVVNGTNSSLPINKDIVGSGFIVSDNNFLGVNSSIVQNNRTYTLTIVNGSAYVSVSGLTGGLYTIQATYSGNENLLSVETVKNVYVNRINPNIDVSLQDIVVGEDLILNISLDSDATGIIGIEIDNRYYNLTVVDGKAQLTISDLASGIHNIYITYGGDVNYLSGSINYTVIVKGVNKTTPTVDIYVNDITAGENLIINISVSDNAKGNVTVTVVPNNNSSSDNIGDMTSNSTFVVINSDLNTIVHVIELDDYGFAYLSIPNLSEGSYIIEVTYNGSEYLTSAYANKTVKVKSTEKTTPIIIIDVVTDAFDADINIITDAIGEYTVEIESPYEVVYNKTVTVTNSTFNIKLYELDGANYTVKVTYNGNDEYSAAVNITIFYIESLIPEIVIDAANITYGEDLFISVHVINATGNISLTVAGKTYIASLENSKAAFTVSELAAGNYTITVNYYGDNIHASDVNISYVTVYKIVSEMNITAYETVVGDNLTIIISANSNVRGNVSLTINNIQYYSVFESGKATFSIGNLSAGSYEYTVNYYGDNQYLPFTESSTVVVSKKESSINLTSSEVVVGDNVVIILKADGDVTGNVSLTINNIVYTDIFIFGEANFTIGNLSAGNYTYTVNYYGNNIYTSYTSSSTVIVNKKESNINVSDSEIIIGDNATITVISDADVTGNVTVTINNLNYTRIFEFGQAVFVIEGLNAGNYNYTLTYMGDINHTATRTTSTLIVNKKVSNININASEVIVGDNASVIISADTDVTGNVILTINNKNYTSEFKSGLAVFEIGGLAVGNYTYTVTYEGDNVYTSNTNSSTIIVNKKESSLTITSANITVGDNITVNIHFDNVDSGNATVIIVDTYYTVEITDGVASLSVKAMTAGEYIITVIYDGNVNITSSKANYTIFVAKKASSLALNVENIEFGDVLTVKVLLNDDATGNVTLTVADKSYTAQVSDGVAVFNISGLYSGSYVITAVYNGDDKYLANSTASSFTVNKINAFLNISTSDIHVGETLNVGVYINTMATGNITVSLNNTYYSATIVNGTVVFNISDLSAGDYNVVVNYFGDSNFNNATSNTNIAVVKNNIILNVETTDIQFGENEIITVTLPADATGNVELTINNETLTAVISEGIVVFNITDPDTGDWEVVVTYSGDDKYLTNSTAAVFGVGKSGTPLNISASDILVGEYLEIIVFVDSEATGNILITLDNSNYTSDIINGTATFTVDNLPAGSYDIIAYYAGDLNFNRANANKTVSVNKYAVTLNVETVNIHFGENEIMTVSLPVDVTGNVILFVNNKTLTASVIDGMALFHLPGLNAGEYSILITYPGDNKYQSDSVNSSFTVSKIETPLNITASDISVGENLEVTILLDRRATGEVLVEVHSVKYTSEIINGTVSLNITNLVSGNYIINVAYAGDVNFVPVNTSTSVNVSKKESDVIVSSGDINYGEELIINISSTADGIVTVIIDNRQFNVNVSNNTASLSVYNLTAGTYDITAIFNTNDEYLQSANMTSVYVSKIVAEISDYAVNISYGENEIITVNLPADATGNISLIVNANRYTASLINGASVFNISDLNAGEYIAAIEYCGDSNYMSLNKSVSFTVSKIASGLNITTLDIFAGDDLTVNITLNTKATGNVEITVDGKNYTLAVADGNAVLNIADLASGSYIINAVYSGDINFIQSNASAEVNVAKKQAVLNLTASNIIYGNDLIIGIDLNTDGEVLILVDNVNYTVETVNGKGILNISNLNPTQYTVYAVYMGNDAFTTANATKTVTVSKKSSSLTVTSSDIIVGNTADINITLPDGATGEVIIAVAGKNITLNVNESNLTLPVSDLASGTYQVSVYYTGDEYYNASSATTSFKVSKKSASLLLDVKTVNKIGDDIVITVITDEDAAGTVSLQINQLTRTANLLNGTAAVTLTGMAKGSYNVTATYNGDNVFESVSNTTFFKVVDSTFIDLQALIDSSNGTVDLNRDYIYDETVDSTVKITKAVTINGNGHTIDAAGKTTIFDISSDNVILNSLVLTGAKGVDGGAVKWSGNKGSISSSHITNSTAMRGAAIFITGADINITSTTFDYNTANTGAAVMSQGANTTIYNSLFTYNKATLGAGVVLNGNDAEVYYSNFMFNNAMVGAGLVINGDNALIFASNFMLNEATIGAGAVSYGRQTTCVESIFADNKVFTDYTILSSANLLKASADDILAEATEENGFGAGLVIYGDDAVIKDSEFLRNNASQGAGLVLKADNCSVAGSTFENNTADEGAGVVIEGNDAEIADSTFSSNSAKTGAGIISTGAKSVIKSSKFLANTAETGAGILSSGVDALIDNSSFINNNADNGAGIVSNGDNITVSASNFESNTAGTGAGILSNGNDAAILSSTFTSNNAETGAGVVLSGDNSVISETRFEDNNASEGAGVVVKGTNANLVNTTFENNTADSGKSVYIESNATVKIEEDVVLDDKKAVNYPSEVHVNVNSVTFGENAVIEVKVTSTYDVEITGNVTIKIANRDYLVSLVNATASQSVAGLAVGSYQVSVIYNGDDAHSQSNSSAAFSVLKISKFNVTTNVTGAYDDENAVVTLNLPDGATGNITATLNGKTYSAVIKDSKASVELGVLTAGSYVLSVSYSGDKNYDTYIFNAGVVIEKNTKPVITAPAVTKYVKGSERLQINVTDYQGKALAGAKVNITINNVTYTRTADENGYISMALGLNSGNYTVTVLLLAGDSYVSREINTTVTILATMSGNNITKVYRNATQYYATFKDTNGNLLVNTQITFNINGVFYNRTTNASGVARLNINLPQGTYILTAINPVNGEMYSNTITVLPTITENSDLTKYYKNESQYVVKLVGSDGKVVGAGEKVSFNINGVFYTRTTNETGHAKININLPAGNYVITAEYNGCRVSNNIDVLPILTADDLVMKYHDGSKFAVKLVNGQGKSYVGESVTFNVNGVFYQRTTDEEGIARLNINLMAGVYIITSSYNNFNIANTITING